MERRLFLAMGLSMMVLWVWSLSLPKSSRNPSSVVQKHSSEANKESSQLLPAQEVISIKKDLAPLNEKIDSISNRSINLSVSTKGAKIVKIDLPQYNAIFPLRDVEVFVGYEDIDFEIESQADNKIVYYYDGSKVRIKKYIDLSNDDYLIRTKMIIENKTDEVISISEKVKNFTIDMSSLDNNKNLENNRDKSLNEYVINSYDGILRKSGAFKFNEKEMKSSSGKVYWTAFRNRYYCFIFKHLFNNNGYSIYSDGEHTLTIQVESEQLNISPNNRAELESIIFAGPERTEILQKYGYGFEKVKRYYRFGLFDGIAKIIDSMMRGLNKIFPNWGICILLISTIIYFSMYPLTLRSMVSMKKMQSLQPKILQLKEKYKDNPQRMNKEMMELYKENKVNPFGGCLPMLLQMPVFIGLYQVLWRSVSFNGAHFLWIKDLSQPDRLFTLPFNMPIIGNEINILPIIMIFVMFFQQKLSAKNMVAVDPAQVSQQKMMTIFMPLFLGFIFYKFASGLTLYFTMFYLFSTISQWKMSKKAHI